MSSKAKKQSRALHISCFWIDQCTWELAILTYFTSLYDCSAQPLSEPLSVKQQQGKEQSRNFSPTAWAEIYKNLNQHHRIYAEAFMQHSPLCYLPGLLEWMANMVENTLLSWCFAFCKRSSFVSPTLVLNWTPSTKVSVGKVTTCSAIALKKMLLCYFIYGRKFLVFTQ